MGGEAGRLHSFFADCGRDLCLHLNYSLLMSRRRFFVSDDLDSDPDDTEPGGSEAETSLVFRFFSFFVGELLPSCRVRESKDSL